VFPATGDFASFNYPGLDCDSEPDESCSITNPDEGDPMLALVFLVLLGLRRRDRSA
jgi:MYXO-CTERM domain-containing protein